MSDENAVPVAESGVPEERWKNVHPLTPLINSWKLIAALLGVTLWQNPEIITHLRDPEVSIFLQRDGAVLYAILAMVGLLALLLIAFYIEWRKTTYALGDEAVWFRHGVLMRQQRHARYDRIQAVDIVHPLLGRIFGLGKLHIEVAGGADSNVEVAYLPTALLEELRQQVTVLATRSSAQANAASSATHQEATANPQSQTPEGNEAGLASSMARREERPLYLVPSDRHLMSLIRSGKLLVSVLILLTALAFVIVPMVAVGEWGISLAVLPGILPMLLIPAGIVWSEFNGNFAFRSFLTPEGIRVQRGLTDTRSQTIPPKRVHAVEVSQPLLWRSKDWYRVRILQAGYVGQEEKSDSNILLPVGTRQEAELAMWLVQPDLGVQDPLALIHAALVGNREIADPYFVNVPQLVRRLDWFSWKRKAFALTNTALIVRDGWLTRRVTILPVERLQSLAIHQGPLQRSLKVASLQMQMVPGQLITMAQHLDVEHAQELLKELLALAHKRRLQEDGLTWDERIEGELSPYEAADATETPQTAGTPRVNAPEHGTTGMGAAEHSEDSEAENLAEDGLV